MTNAKLPDALRLSGLRSSCNILNFHAFVGRIRRSRRIRHEQSALCQQFGPVKYKHSIKPAKNYRFINKYILTPDLFSPIDNHHYVFYFFTAKSLAHSAALRHFFKQANTTSNKYQVNGEGYVFNFWRIRYQNRRS
ncbi:hypothetical protein GNP10_11230 [Escherichia coli]|nr:hypothetical protein [Escherichia coli]